MTEKKQEASAEGTSPEAGPTYQKPTLKRLGDVSELTKSRTTFSNLHDSSNILGSDYS